MKGFAIHNAPTDHGGLIPSTQVRSSQQGNLFVRAGDGHFCPKCKCWSTVIKSHDLIIFDGKAVAYAGDKLTCGATIQPQQSHVVGDSGGVNYAAPIFQSVKPQNNLENSFFESKKTDSDKAYYKWWWGASAYKNPKTNEQQNNSFLTNFDDLHNAYAFDKQYKIYEVDPKAWDSEVAFEELLPIIQKSADTPNYTLGSALASIQDGQSVDIIWVRVGVGGDYLKIGQTKHWPHGRLSLTIYGSVTKLGMDANGRNDFQFTGYAKISNDIYSWDVDYKGYKALMIRGMGAVVEKWKGSKDPSSVYNPGPDGKVGLPTTYTRYYHFDYYKKGVKPPVYEN